MPHGRRGKAWNEHMQMLRRIKKEQDDKKAHLEVFLDCESDDEGIL